MILSTSLLASLFRYLGTSHDGSGRPILLHRLDGRWNRLIVGVRIVLVQGRSRKMPTSDTAANQLEHEFLLKSGVFHDASASLSSAEHARHSSSSNGYVLGMLLRALHAKVLSVWAEKNFLDDSLENSLPTLPSPDYQHSDYHDDASRYPNVRKRRGCVGPAR